MHSMIHRKMFIRSLALVAILGSFASAEVKLPKMISSNMLLQRGVPASIWGTANDGEKVTVTFAGQTKVATAGSDGKWSVALDPLEANGTGREMVISGTNEIKLSNVIVGDVWICSGQSNMEYSLKRRKEYRGPPAGEVDEATAALQGKHEGLRLFKVQKVLSADDVTSDGWIEAEGEGLGNFSAVAYFFAHDVYEQTKVPIGVVDTSWGGSRIELWTDTEVYPKYPDLKNVPTTRPMYLEGAPVGKYYSRMVKPLTPYTIKGFLWYQGESNLMTGETDQYTIKMRALVESWRDAWRAPQAPFYYVQIAPLLYTARKQAPPLPEKVPVESLPRFWESQKNALAIPNTGMVVTTDLCANLNDIHPYNKWEVGRRLSLLALSRDYGKKDLISSGPVYTNMRTEGNAAIAEFSEVGSGLKTRDGKAPSDFLISGDDNLFAPAEAEIVGKNQIKLTSAKVAKPTQIRFAWSETAQPNVYNSVELPMVPFRTDKLPDKSAVGQ